MKIIKKEGGLVFRDQFTSQTNWMSTSPQNTSYGAGLVLTHNANKDVRVMRDIPQNANMFELIVDYTPTDENDLAGIILYAADDTILEIIEAPDDNQGNITDYKIIRQNGEFNVFILRDGVYEFVTSSDSAFKKIGFVTKQGLSTYEPLKALEVIAAKSNFLTYTGLPDGCYIMFTDGDKTTSETAVNGVVTYEMAHTEQTLTVKIYTDSDELVYEVTQLFEAGSEYYASSELVLLKNGVPLSLDNDNEIGSIVGSVVEKQLELHNPLAYPVHNVYVQVIEYLGFYGYSLADIALDVNGAPGAYNDELLIETLDANSSVFFWFKFDKTNDTSGASSLYTRIAISHD